MDPIEYLAEKMKDLSKECLEVRPETLNDMFDDMRRWINHGGGVPRPVDRYIALRIAFSKAQKKVREG